MASNETSLQTPTRIVVEAQSGKKINQFKSIILHASF